LTISHRKVHRNREVLWREEDDSRADAYAGLAKGEDAGDIGTAVLFADGVMLSLNVLGTEIWKRCDGRTVEAIVSDLTQEFDVEPDVLEADALTFLAELEQKGFIRYEVR
jgi:pyrroloquinoline quinone biosynthesis protein D